MELRDGNRHSIGLSLYFWSPKLWRNVFVALLGVLSYLSFKPNPAMQEVAWMPRSLAEWFDLYDQWKNLLGFAAMGFAGFMAWPEGAGGGGPARRRIKLALSLCCIIVVMELIQIPIPTRWCDPKDIFAGSIGVWLSWPMASGFRRMLGSHPK